MIQPLAADGELIRLVYEWGWRRRIMTVARRGDFATRIDVAAGGPHHGRLVERRRRTDLAMALRSARTLAKTLPTQAFSAVIHVWR